MRQCIYAIVTHAYFQGGLTLAVAAALVLVLALSFSLSLARSLALCLIVIIIYYMISSHSYMISMADRVETS
jgi:hypothetical protein